MEQFSKYKILIVEDNEIFRNMIQDKLTSVGYAFSSVTSDVSIQKIRDMHPSVVLVDVVSPKEKGLRLIENMKTEGDLANIPVIAMVKMEDSVIAEHAQGLNVNYVIDKVVFQADDLFAKITACLDGSHAIEDHIETVSTNSQNEADQKKIGKLLLVEDDMFMRDLFAESLRRAGFDVTAQESAEAGLSAIEGGLVPDVILLDLLLPGKSGFEFLVEVKHNERLKKIPVIVVSNLGSRGDIDRAMDLGASDFLIKANATIDEIIMKAKEHMEKSQRPPHLPKSVM